MSDLLTMPPLAVRGRDGYWGATVELERLTYRLIRAIKTPGESTAIIVRAIGREIAAETGPTPDQQGWWTV